MCVVMHYTLHVFTCTHTILMHYTVGLLVNNITTHRPFSLQQVVYVVISLLLACALHLCMHVYIHVHIRVRTMLSFGNTPCIIW